MEIVAVGRMYASGSQGGPGAIRGLTFCGRNDIVEVVPWDRPFAESVELPKGRTLVPLRDAALYITKLPKAEHDAEEWQAAMEALMLVTDLGGPTMFARMGMMRALNGGTSTRATRSSGPRKKAARKYRIVR
jgi:hypothetical protein